MITEQEQKQIRLLSDTELYSKAVEFMQHIPQAIPQRQTNGLLNVSLANTYEQLHKFVAYQRDRKSWPIKDKYIQDFYRDLHQKFRQIEGYVPSIVKSRAKPPSPEDVQVLNLLLAREFIQHILAENAYKDALKNTEQSNPRNQGQGKPQENNRGSVTRNGRI